MKHSINELYYTATIKEGTFCRTYTYFTERYREANNIPLTKRFNPTDDGMAHRLNSKMGDSFVLLDTNGKRRVYLYGEKTWFDTEEERDAYREKMRDERAEEIARNKVKREIAAILDQMTTEELQALLTSLFID
jgi:hypothetical protein